MEAVLAVRRLDKTAFTRDLQEYDGLIGGLLRVERQYRTALQTSPRDHLDVVGHRSTVILATTVYALIRRLEKTALKRRL